MDIKFYGKIVAIENLKIATGIGMFFGLMFSSINNKNLLFSFRTSRIRSIHSLFVFYPFLALWLDSQNNVIDKRVVKPFSFSVKPRFPFCKLIEIPLNKNNRRAFSFLVAKQKDL